MIHTTTQFITAVVAVQYSVALVRLLHALSQIRTLELCSRASNGRAAFLVLVVKAVVVAVAHPRLRDTVARTRACELNKNKLFNFFFNSCKYEIHQMGFYFLHCFSLCRRHWPFFQPCLSKNTADMILHQDIVCLVLNFMRGAVFCLTWHPRSKSKVKALFNLFCLKLRVGSFGTH